MTERRSTVARAESKMIMGYLPIEERHYPALLSLVASAHTGVRLLDPFAGEGAFLEAAAKAMAKLYRHVTQLVNVPVFDAWSAYLYDAGQRAMLVRKTRSVGGIDLLSVDLDVDAWTRLITGGLNQEKISLEPRGRISNN